MIQNTCQAEMISAILSKPVFERDIPVNLKDFH